MEPRNFEADGIVGGAPAVPAGAASPIELSLACGERLHVHRFSIRKALSSLFAVRILARSPDPFIDLKAIVGQPTALRIASGYRLARGGERL